MKLHSMPAAITDIHYSTTSAGDKLHINNCMVYLQSDVEQAIKEAIEKVKEKAQVLSVRNYNAKTALMIGELNIVELESVIEILEGILK